MTTAPESTSYRSLFGTPAQVLFVFATFLGRIPISMKALGAILLIQQTTGSYSLAGLVGATQTLVAAVASPQLGRLMDRTGGKPVILWTAIAHLVGMLLLIVAAEREARPALILLGAAIIGGSSVQFGSLSRARWVALLGKGQRLDKAYALEAMADETGFVIGPLIVVPLAVSIGASVALLVALAFTLIASAILVLQPTPQATTAVSLHPSDQPDSGRAVMSIPGMQVITGSLLFLGIVFGAVEIVLVAFAQANDFPGSASIMASTFAFGSLLGAVMYGAIRWTIPIAHPLKLSLVWFTLGTIPMFLSSTVWQMTAAIFVTGLSISPAMIATNGVVETLSPPKRLTEAFTWVGSALATGAALGSLLIGVVLDELGLRSGQSVGVMGSVISLLIIVLLRRYLVADRPPTRVA